MDKELIGMRGSMNEEMYNKFQDWLFQDWLTSHFVTPTGIEAFLWNNGYVIVKKEDLIKKAGLIVAEELGVK